MMVELTKVPAKQAREQRAMVRLIPEQRKDKVRGEGAIVSFQHRLADLCRSQNATIPRTQPKATSLGSYRKARCSAPLTAVFCYQACAKVYQEIVCTDERARPSLENQIAEISEREQGFQHCDKSFRSSEKNNFFLQSYFFCNI